VKNNYYELLQKAKLQIPRQADGSFRETELLASLAALVPLDDARKKRRLAKAIIDRATRPGGTPATGRLRLPKRDKPPKAEEIQSDSVALAVTELGEPNRN
jgi:hypothetical protein